MCEQCVRVDREGMCVWGDVVKCVQETEYFVCVCVCACVVWCDVLMLLLLVVHRE